MLGRGRRVYISVLRMSLRSNCGADEDKDDDNDDDSDDYDDDLDTTTNLVDDGNNHDVGGTTTIRQRRQ